MMTFVIESSFKEQFCRTVKFRCSFYMQLPQQYLLMPARVWPLLTFSESTICVLVRYHLVYAHHITLARAMWCKVLGIRRIEAIQYFARESAKNGKLLFFAKRQVVNLC